MKQQMKQAVLDTAKSLLQAQNTITTLEVKNQVRKDYPHFRWKQHTDTNGVQGVSELMDELYHDGKLIFTDGGIFRVYSLSPTATLPVPIVAVTNSPNKQNGHRSTVISSNGKAKRISRTKAYELMTNNKGHFFTATFIKKSKDGILGDERTINCQYMKGKQDTVNLGYIRVKETGKMKTGKNPVKQINLQTIKELHIGGQLYKIS